MGYIINKKYVLFCISFTALFLLTGCKSAAEYELYGFNQIWYPARVWWDWQWNDFTPNFWSFIERVWELPTSIAWLAGILVNLLGAIFYVVIIIVLCVLYIIASILLAIAWFLVGLVYGFWQWDQTSA